MKLPLSKRDGDHGEIDEATAKWREQFIRKVPCTVPPILPGTKIYLVDAEAIRNLLYSDFNQAGNGYRYPWIPKDEIWIDERTDPKEIHDILLHESVEIRHMSEGDSYDKAHEIAKKEEDELRETEVPQYELEP